ncbi:pyridine nucleotide-disulfide oxidoreductase, partial [Streptomyces sp. NPDC048254]
ILGKDGHVTGLRTERTALDGTGNVKGTGEFKNWELGAVYRAVGYLSDKLPKLPWDIDSGTVPDEGGRVIEDSGNHLRSTYVTGWIRRGPVGLIGHTKGDANETVSNLLDDHANGRLGTPESPAPEAVNTFLTERNVRFTTWESWHKLDAAEKALGEPQGRERVKLVERKDMLRESGAGIRS